MSKSFANKDNDPLPSEQPQWKTKVRKLNEKEIQAQEKLLSRNLREELDKYCYIVLTGGLVVQKGQHRFVENRYIGPGIEDQIFFNINEGEVTLSTLPSTCYLRVHRIWLERAKKQHKSDMEEYAKRKLMAVPFFANLDFPEFEKCYRSATIMVLGPGDVLLQEGATPYHLYVVAEGELTFEKTVKFLRDSDLWQDVKNELQRQEDTNC